MGVLTGCKPRAEVLEGELQDSIFAADFGELIEGSAHAVYRDAATFFRNTHPAAQLQQIVKAVFGRLARTDEGGALLRLSTGFGGGKTHTLMTLWHLAQQVGDLTLGAELLPAVGRPAAVKVVAIDASKAGGSVFAGHGAVQTHSLAGEIFWQLGGAAALRVLGAADAVNDRPAQQQLDQVLPAGPLLILLDELVVYQRTLAEQGKGNLLAFLNLLLRKVASRPQTVLVVTDPGSQQVYAADSEKLSQSLDANDLDELLDRTTSDFDPIGQEAPQVIARRLFEEVSQHAAQTAAATYHSLYERVRGEHPELLPPAAAHPDYTARLAACYPFHPRLFETARNRLGALQDFQQSRGVLRLFARLIRDVWERGEDLELITAGDLNWSNPSLQADLLDRINRRHFRAAIGADLEGHAQELDGGPTGPHRRVAAALLLESLELTPTSGLNEPELTLAVLRPEEAGPEPAEAMGRLAGSCWHTYPLASGSGLQFRYEPNVIKQIEERMQQIGREDARSDVRAEIQKYFGGPAFKTVNWPDAAREVPDAAVLQLVLCESLERAQAVVRWRDDADPAAPQPRQYRNAMVAVAPEDSAWQEAVTRAQRFRAAQAIADECKQVESQKLARDQVSRLLPEYQKQFRLQTRRAFVRVVLADRTVGMEEQYQTDEQVLQTPSGQVCLRTFLDHKGLLYQPDESLDPDLFCDRILPGATMLASQPDVKTARAVHERVLSAQAVEKLVPDEGFTRRTLARAVAAGRVVLRLADGSAWDRDGCVQGPAGQRLRQAAPLPGFPLDETVQVAQAEHASAKLWLQVDEPQPDDDDHGPGGGGVWPPPPPPTGGVTATTWPEIVDYAGARPLRHLTLRTTAPAAANVLTQLAQPLGADQLEVQVSLDGTLKDGGTLGLVVDGVRLGSGIEPFELVQRLHRALAAGAQCDLGLRLLFNAGRTGLAGALDKVAESASETITVKAEFGPPGDAS